MPSLLLEEAAQGFAAVGSEHRLNVLLTLVRAGDPGMTVGQIQERTGIAPSTLAHHLRFLTAGGLVVQQKEGRSVINLADFDRIRALGDFLIADCCKDMEPQDG